MAEIEFREWTSEGVMRAPSYKGLRDDKPAQSVHRESKPDELFDAVEPLPDGARAVTVDGRRLKITNWDKVLYPQTGLAIVLVRRYDTMVVEYRWIREEMELAVWILGPAPLTSPTRPRATLARLCSSSSTEADPLAG